MYPIVGVCVLIVGVDMSLLEEECTLWFQTLSVRDSISTQSDTRMVAGSHKWTDQLNGCHTATMTYNFKN